MYSLAYNGRHLREFTIKQFVTMSRAMYGTVLILGLCLAVLANAQKQGKLKLKYCIT